MNVVIPMAGAGSRFSQAGYELPKPLIEVEGEPMYSWAVKSFSLAPVKRLIFICLRDHLVNFPLESDIRSRYADLQVEVLGLDRLTSGQAETVLAAESLIDEDAPLIVFNADTYVPEPFTLEERFQGEYDGVIQTFRSEDPRYSFVRVNTDGLVCEVAEKVAISNLATTGLYCFSRGSDYVRYTRRFLDKGRRVNGESYIMLTYDEMLQDGKKIAQCEAPGHFVLGTPEELARFLERTR